MQVNDVLSQIRLLSDEERALVLSEAPFLTGGECKKGMSLEEAAQVITLHGAKYYSYIDSPQKLLWLLFGVGPYDYEIRGFSK